MKRKALAVITQSQAVKLFLTLAEGYIVEVVRLFVLHFAACGVIVNASDVPEFHLTRVNHSKNSATRGWIEFRKGQRPQAWISEEMDCATIWRTIPRLLLQAKAGKTRLNGFGAEVKQIGMTGRSANPEFGVELAGMVKVKRAAMRAYPRRPTFGTVKKSTKKGDALLTFELDGNSVKATLGTIALLVATIKSGRLPVVKVSDELNKRLASNVKRIEKARNARDRAMGVKVSKALRKVVETSIENQVNAVESPVAVQ